MEAWSVEDNGEGICFHVYVYNNQPGVAIDYATGESREDGTISSQSDTVTYIVNRSSGKFHSADCSQGQSMKKDNRQDYSVSRDDMLKLGFTPAKCCNP